MTTILLLRRRWRCGGDRTRELDVYVILSSGRRRRIFGGKRAIGDGPWKTRQEGKSIEKRKKRGKKHRLYVYTILFVLTKPVVVIPVTLQWSSSPAASRARIISDSGNCNDCRCRRTREKRTERKPADRDRIIIISLLGRGDIDYRSATHRSLVHDDIACYARASDLIDEFSVYTRSRLRVEAHLFYFIFHPVGNVFGVNFNVVRRSPGARNRRTDGRAPRGGASDCCTAFDRDIVRAVRRRRWRRPRRHGHQTITAASAAPPPPPPPPDHCAGAHAPYRIYMYYIIIPL